uniref:Uncharacterized protein n=1 Tax=Streptomyces sp. F12 TaxID=1436084 RepID=V9Z4P6_9ACTN|nr:hypothetical protein pFRL6_353 [Streptomyces sp. F12]
MWQVNLPSREREHLHAAALAEARLLLGVNAELRYRDGDRRWALGTALYVGDRPYAVLRPRPQFVNWEQLKGLLIFVRNLDELRILGRTAPDGTRIIILPEQEPPTG